MSEFIAIEVDGHGPDDQLTTVAGQTIRGKVILDLMNQWRPGNLKVGIYEIFQLHSNGKLKSEKLFDRA